MSSNNATNVSITCGNENVPADVEEHGDEIEDGFLDVDLGDGCLPSRIPKVYVRTSAPYIADKGVKRYHAALRNLIPMRPKNLKKEDIGVDQAGLFSFIFNSWMSKLMYKSHRKGLVIDDIPRGSPYESCEYNVQRLEMLWQEEVRNQGPSGASLYRAVLRFSRTRLIADCLAFLISCTFGFVTPMIFMRKLLEYAENPHGDIQDGLTWASLLMFSEFCRIMFFSWKWGVAYRTAVRLRSACLGLMYKKIVRLNNFEEESTGQLINIFTNDSQRIFDMISFGPMVIGGPLVLICGVVYVLYILGPWALFGILVFVLFYPVQYGISRMSGLLRGKTVRVSDKRVSLMNEILTNMKTIKVNAWEESFKDNIFKIRSHEQSFIQKTTYLSTLGSSLAPTVPMISAIVTFMGHIGSGNILTAAQAFPFVSVMTSQARNFMNVTRIALMNIFEAKVGLKRMQKCLLAEEVQTRIQRPIDRSQAVSIGGANFSWGSCWSPSIHTVSKKGEKTGVVEKIRKSDIEAAIEEREKLKKDDNGTVEPVPILRGINFCAPKGHLVGVCGQVGSGKTSLLLAILGQMRLTRGQLARDGSCAYVSQQAWITNGTLRDNILFGETFVSNRYYKVVSSCCLNDDINLLPGNDLTEIGERGVNLSGGQKQRVALARALYANKDIYLLDDPLSAVDVNVGARIFENYIQGELRNKAVVLVTHQIQYLSHCDEIYVMKDGSISEKGTHAELLQLDKEYASMVKQITSAASVQPSSEVEGATINGNDYTLRSPLKRKDAIHRKDEKHNVIKDGGGKLTVDEPSTFGSLKADTYFRYVSAAGGYFITFIVFLVFFVNVGSTAFSSWWLAMWIKAGAGNATVEVNNVTVPSTNLGDNPDYAFYQTIYGSTIFLILLTGGLRCLVFTKATIRASSALHKELFLKVLYSPMLFFESNPIGRMQNLFSKDMDEVDSRLPVTVESIVQNCWVVSFAILFVCIVFPWFFVAFIPLSIIYYFLSRIFRKGVRDLKRLENTTRSPVISILAETLQGLNTIHAFNKEGDYTQRFFNLYDENATCNYLYVSGTRWLAVRVDLLAAVTMSTTAFLVVLLHGNVAPAMAGLALAYSWHISGVLQYTTRLISEAEVRFISVERILAYVETTVVEGQEKCIKPPSSWPQKGIIRFQNVSLSYRKNLPNILHKISFNTLSGEKIGVVGRTGAGKSSLSVALFRLVELNNGSISLDGLDISEVPLPVLRSKISIIPQDPVLFSGTIRSNLDRYSKFNDKELWEILDKTMLSNRISAMPLKLDTAISTGSSGLSVGECQLMCLARALLENCKVLILDEATASIDPDTEAAVQCTIQKEFESCTVLIIAHRLTTVTNCDRILVMEEGKVVEFDSPKELLANPNSFFSKMMASAEATTKNLTSA